MNERQNPTPSSRRRVAPQSPATLFSVVMLQLALLIAGPIAAQDGANADAEAALDVVEALFDGMRARDADAMAALFSDAARLVTAGEGQDGTPRLSTQEISGWLDAVRGADAMLDEKIWDPVVEVSDRLATVWVKYALYVNEDFIHCGVDAFTLFLDTEGWRIVQVVDTRRRENCWYPPA